MFVSGLIPHPACIHILEFFSRLKMITLASVIPVLIVHLYPDCKRVLLMQIFSSRFSQYNCGYDIIFIPVQHSNNIANHIMNIVYFVLDEIYLMFNLQSTSCLTYTVYTLHSVLRKVLYKFYAIYLQYSLPGLLVYIPNHYFYYILGVDFTG